MSYLILGGTGTVGSTLVEELLARGEGPIRVLTRSAEKAADLPAGVEGVVGDLMDPATYERVFAGAGRLFLLNAVSPTELHEGLAALNEARRAGADHVVYLSVHDVDGGLHIPHFASKSAVEKALRASDLPWTILRPNSFYQNDLRYREAIVEGGVYPQPLGDVGLSRVDVGDIARAAANAFTQPGHEGRTYALVGPEALTGEDSARIWGEVLGREVRYGGNDLEAWQEQVLRMLPAWMVYDLHLMYAMFQEEGLRATDAQLEETRRIVGADPRSFREFAKETAEGWR